MNRNEILKEIAEKTALFQISSIEMMDASEDDIQKFYDSATVEYAKHDNGAEAAIISYNERVAGFVWVNGNRSDGINVESLRNQLNFNEI